MKILVKFFLFLSFLLPACILLCATISWAVFELSVTPYIGGPSEIRFERLEQQPASGVEMRFTITSDIGKPYEVMQSLLEPLTTVSGATIPNSALTFYGLSGSNSQGILNYQDMTQLGMGDLSLYTSDASGTADSFIVVYGLNIPPGQAPGEYRGRISFTLRPQDRTQEPQILVLDVYAEITSHTQVEIVTPDRSQVIQLDPLGIPAQDSIEVQVNITGPMGSPYRIFQVCSPYFEKEDIQASLDHVNYKVSGVRTGTAGASQETALTSQPALLYTSDTMGGADSFTVTYSFNRQAEDLYAGLYKTEFIYLFESSGAEESKDIGRLELRLNIEPQFNLCVLKPEGSITFSALDEATSTKTAEVHLQVESNVGKEYEVIQVLPELPTDVKGNSISPEYLKVQTLSMPEEEVLGRLQFLEKTPIKEGDSSLYISDNKGSPVRFRVFYELYVFRDQPAGQYSFNISYRIAER